MKGTELAIRFSFIVNELGYCGPAVAKDPFLAYFSKDKPSEEEVTKQLKRFEGMYPHVKSIAKKTGKAFTDFDVVEAYWIGNDLLEECDGVSKEIIEMLMQRGFPESLGKKLIEDLPEDAFPHHFFHVMYDGVGNTTGKVETTLQNMDNCRPSWGTVVEVLNDKLMVETQALELNNKKYLLGPEEIKTAIYLPEMLPSIKKGEIVALHWGFAAMVLSEVQLTNLKKYTQKVLDIVNQDKKKV